MSNYFGDLAPNNTRTSTALQYSRTFFTAYYLQRVHPNVTIRGAFSWMILRGDDFSVSEAGSPDMSDYGRFIRNLSFRNNIYELSGIGLFELFPTDRGYLRRTFVNPYFMMGLSVFTHNPVSTEPIDPAKNGANPKTLNLRELGTEGQFTGVAGTPKPYSLVQLGVPLGVGVRYRLLDKFDLSLELGYRFVFTDYIDDVSGRYPSEEVYKEMYDAGNYTGIAMSNRSYEQYAAMDWSQNGGRIARDKKLVDISNNFRAERQKIRSGLSNPSNWEYYVQQNPGQDLPDDLTQNQSYYLARSDNGQYFRRIKGNEYGAAPRGNKRRDYWLVTALNLSYILEIKQKPPKFR